MQNLYEYQKKLVEQISGGLKKGEMVVFTSGRRTGKSSWINELIKQMKPIKILTQSEVDGVTWYTITCNLEVFRYIKSPQVDPNLYYEHKVSTNRFMFDVHEKLMTLISLVHTK
jgi:ABC-type multidrug transport system ATPase subunit